MLTSFGVLGLAPNLSLVHFQCDYMLPSLSLSQPLWIGESPGQILSTHDDLCVDLPSKPTYLQVFAFTIREFWRAWSLVIPFQPKCNLLGKNESPNLLWPVEKGATRNHLKLWICRFSRASSVWGCQKTQNHRRLSSDLPSNLAVQFRAPNCSG